MVLPDSPHLETFSENMLQCMKDLEKKRGIDFKAITGTYEDTPYGKDSSRLEWPVVSVLRKM